MRVFIETGGDAPCACGCEPIRKPKRGLEYMADDPYTGPLIGV